VQRKPEDVLVASSDPSLLAADFRRTWDRTVARMNPTWPKSPDLVLVARPAVHRGPSKNRRANPGEGPRQGRWWSHRGAILPGSRVSSSCVVTRTQATVLRQAVARSFAQVLLLRAVEPCLGTTDLNAPTRTRTRNGASRRRAHQGSPLPLGSRARRASNLGPTDCEANCLGRRFKVSRKRRPVCCPPLPPVSMGSMLVRKLCLELGAASCGPVLPLRQETGDTDCGA
jgi:hypothetical protein